ncbi:MAG: hypothetical protein KBD00_03610 [Candidatus Peribacteraceae bacterium]|nr:hypothetical protein [Candidatus Peribacteraceae bacterium]
MQTPFADRLDSGSDHSEPVKTMLDRHIRKTFFALIVGTFGAAYLALRPDESVEDWPKNKIERLLAGYQAGHSRSDENADFAMKDTDLRADIQKEIDGLKDEEVIELLGKLRATASPGDVNRVHLQYINHPRIHLTIRFAAAKDLLKYQLQHDQCVSPDAALFLLLMHKSQPHNKEIMSMLEAFRSHIDAVFVKPDLDPSFRHSCEQVGNILRGDIGPYNSQFERLRQILSSDIDKLQD